MVSVYWPMTIFLVASREWTGVLRGRVFREGGTLGVSFQCFGQMGMAGYRSSLHLLLL